MGPSTFTQANRLKVILRGWMAAIALASATQVVAAQTIIPIDEDQTCVVAKKEFKGWFASDGSVIPPDDVHFPKNPDSACPFFRWAEHMFLWVTSRPAHENKRSHVFDSSPFYAVSPLKDNRRTLIAQDHSGQSPREQISLSISQHGPGDQAVLFDEAGAMHKIVQIEGGGKPFVDREGRKIEIGKVRIAPDGFPIFYDTLGNPIENPVLRNLVSGAVVELKPPPENTIVSNGHLFLLDQAGDAVAAEPGQADDHALMAQGDRLVYYMIHVNDVYAYFLTGTKNHKINLSTFPTDGPEVSLVEQYARDHGLTSFPDERASVVELKSSWIELRHGEDYNQYIWIVANVPKFKRLSNAHLHQIGWRKGVKLAMLGMHIAFSVNGHPELIWATFEHINNAPDVQYRYDAIGDTQPRSKQSCGSWLFSSGRAEPDPDNERDCYGTKIHACGDGLTVDANGMCIAANHSRMYVEGHDIYAYEGDTIGPTDVLRINAWGNSQFRPTFNAGVISINNSIWHHLAFGDVRKNYMMIGAIYLDSIGGEADTDCTISSAGGSNCAANSSIEAFQQPSNCMYCHKDPADMLGGESHVYKPLAPLFIDAMKPPVR